MNRKKAINRSHILRLIIQIVFFIVLPSAFDSAFSAVKEAAEMISGGEELSFTPFARIFLFLIAFTIICGRMFCGYACAFGSLGDWIYNISQFIQKKTNKKLPAIPEKYAQSLQLVKYAVLILIIVLCFLGFAGSLGQSSPWTVFSLIISGRLPGKELIVGIILLIAIVIGMALRPRFFCQFLCPLGAIFSLLPILNSGRMRRDTSGCIKGCAICSRNCPVSLKLGEIDIREGECIMCDECAVGCPKGCIKAGPLSPGLKDDLRIVIEAAVLLVVLKFVI